jgi:nicotinamide riboside kinase
MKIAVIGPQNTGKTIFILEFEKLFPQYYSPKSSYRELIRDRNLPINQKTTFGTQKAIYEFVKNQMIDCKDKDNVIFDRSIIDVFVYSSQLYDTHPAFISKMFDEIKGVIDYMDMILVFPTSLSIPIVEDGVRDTEIGYIDYINEQFLETVISFASYDNSKFVVMSGTTAEKIEKIKPLIN